jgi:hypothetical protein
MEQFHTSPVVFVLILAGYVGLSLLLGGKSAFFEPYKGGAEESEARESSSSH